MCNKYKYCDCFVEYTNFKDDLSEYKFLRCNKSYQRKFDEKLKKVFFSTCNFSNHGNNYFIITKRCLTLRIYGCLGKIQ